MYLEYPDIKTGGYTKELKMYYLITLGYHINSTRAIFWSYCNNQNKNDWIEMLLHHMLTVALYMFSYMLLIIKHGSLIMFLHDWADIWTPFVKIWVETTYKKMTIAGAAICWIVWVYSRLIVFPQIIYYGIHAYPKPTMYPNWQQEGHID
jgi:hypothetical protein